MPVGPTLSVFLCPCFFDWGYMMKFFNLGEDQNGTEKSMGKAGNKVS